jgi:hypothetical protein
VQGSIRNEEQPRVALRRRLEARRAEIGRAITTRVYGIADPDEVADPEYAHGLRGAVLVALDYGIAAVGRSEEVVRPVPRVLLVQAQAAARGGVEFDTVLRRYVAGHALLDDFIVEEAESCGSLESGALKYVLRVQAVLFDRLLAVVSEEYARGMEARIGSSKMRHAERVERLLAGELVDTSGVAYQFNSCHVGLVAAGPSAAKAAGDLADALDCAPLIVQRDEGVVWAWLGGRRPVDADRVGDVATEIWPAQNSLAIGEPGEGLDGWRLTHRQARAAHPVALRRAQGPVLYSDVALLVSALQDDLLATSLQQLYLDPLADSRDGGKGFRKTLQAYFSSERQISSTAKALGVSRNTVASHLRAIEDRLPRPSRLCWAELETALRLEEFRQLPLPASAEQIAESSALH